MSRITQLRDLIESLTFDEMWMWADEIGDRISSADQDDYLSPEVIARALLLAIANCDEKTKGPCGGSPSGASSVICAAVSPAAQ